MIKLGQSLAFIATVNSANSCKSNNRLIKGLSKSSFLYFILILTPHKSNFL